MSDNNSEKDDFDIYADLEEDNIQLNFNENNICFDNQNIFEKDFSSILRKTTENNNINEDNITENETQNTLDFDVNVFDMNVDNERYVEQCLAKIPETQSSNDLILSEISILEKSLNKTEDNNKTLLNENLKLRQELKEKDKHITILKTNISSLYKTAKAEIERKKNEIQELRSELDSILFRRIQNKTKTEELKLPVNGIKNNNNNNNNSNQSIVVNGETETQKTVITSNENLSKPTETRAGDRDRQRDRNRDRERDRERDKERAKERDKKREREREREKRERERNREKRRERERERELEREKRRERERRADKQTNK